MEGHRRNTGEHKWQSKIEMWIGLERMNGLDKWWCVGYSIGTAGRGE